MRKPLSLLVLLTYLLFSTSGYSVGFYNPDQGAKSQGQANAFVAQADDASAAYFNPAGMAWIDGIVIQFGGMALLTDIEHLSPAGARTKTKDDAFFIPNFYVTGNVPNTDFSVGLNFNVPFGLGTDWGSGSFARFVAPDSELMMYNVNPSVAYKVNEKLAVAGGIDYYFSDLSNSQDTIAGPMLGIPDTTTISSMKLDVDGSGWGWNAALLYRISEQHSFGISYRSKVDADLEGDLKLSDLPAALGLGPSMTVDASLEFKYPSYVKAGYAFRPNEKLKVEFDIDWLEWSRFDTLTVEIDSPGLPDIPSVREWDDSFIYAIGLEYILNESWCLRAGYAFADTPVPEKTFIPDVPRSDLSVVSVGVGYSRAAWRVDAAYTGIISEDRDIDNDVGAPFASIDGTYESFVSVIGVNFSYEF